MPPVELLPEALLVGLCIGAPALGRARGRGALCRQRCQWCLESVRQPMVPMGRPGAKSIRLWAWLLSHSSGGMPAAGGSGTDFGTRRSMAAGPPALGSASAEAEGTASTCSGLRLIGQRVAPHRLKSASSSELKGPGRFLSTHSARMRSTSWHDCSPGRVGWRGLGALGNTRLLRPCLPKLQLNQGQGTSRCRHPCLPPQTHARSCSCTHSCSRPAPAHVLAGLHQCELAALT